ncbi:MAG: hypothetical protein Q8O27_01595 [Enterobacteriaceae bacterium]|nr:hypothetical protein [Enterobacteriaceae bacterium]
MDKLEIYLVGGAVRDKLLGIFVKECDWVVIGSTLNHMISLKFKQVGKNFPVFIHPIDKEEYALARKDRKISFGYHGFDFDISTFVTLEQDLFRRDLTINAIALNKIGKLIDPYFGVLDLKNKILRHVSSSFKEDPVRILRVARFAAKFKEFGFFIFSDTLFLMRCIVDDGDADFLTSERIWKEFIIAAKTKFLYVFFDVLKLCNVLKIFFFELYVTFNISYIYKYNFVLNVWSKAKFLFMNICDFINDPYIRISIFCFYLKTNFVYAINFCKCMSYKKSNKIIILNFCDKYKVPGKYKVFFLNLMYLNSFYYRIFKMSNYFTFYILNRINAFKDKSGFLYLLLLCESDIKLNYYFYEKNYCVKYYFLDILDRIDNLKLDYNVYIFNKEKIKSCFDEKKLKIISFYKIFYLNILN